MAMPFLRRQPGLLLLAIALLASSARPALASAEPRLLAPQAGAELAAGSLAVVAWEDPPPEAEEWEAFLSLDGGRTYPLRITPHLDIGIHRFAFHVPPFPTRDARVLLRFGDERREEEEVETEARFTIVTSRALPTPSLGLALSRGEKARPRDSGVVVWVEGERDGSGLRQVAAEATDCSLRSVATARLFWLPLLCPSRQRAEWTTPSVPSQILRSPLPVWLEAEVSASPKARPSVRLLTGRLNE